MALTPKFAITRDDDGNLAYGTKFLPQAYQYWTTLGASTEQTLVVPDNVNTAVFSYSSPTVWVAQGSTPIALIPGAFAETEAVLNHAVKEVEPGETLRFFSTVVAEVGIAFFNRYV